MQRKTTRVLTKEKMALVALWIKTADRDLVRLAAQREGISQSEFLRKSLRDRAQKILLAQ